MSTFSARAFFKNRGEGAVEKDRGTSGRHLAFSYRHSVLPDFRLLAVGEPQDSLATASLLCLIPGERAEWRSTVHLPHLQRVVIRSGDRQPPVSTHRHVPDLSKSGLPGCAARARFPPPTPSACGHKKRRPPAARLQSPPRL